MGISTFNKIVVVKIPAEITKAELKKSLKSLATKAKKDVTGVIVDVSGLNHDENHFKEIAEATGPWARENIDPKLYANHVQKVAFVSPNGKFFGREQPGPIVKDNAPTKDYFTNLADAISWLLS